MAIIKLQLAPRLQACVTLELVVDPMNVPDNVKSSCVMLELLVDSCRFLSILVDSCRSDDSKVSNIIG